MTDHHQRLADLFLQACSLAPAKRASFLDTACAGDAALRSRIVALLRQHEQGTKDYLNDPVLASSSDQVQRRPVATSTSASRSGWSATVRARLRSMVSSSSGGSSSPVAVASMTRH